MPSRAKIKIPTKVKLASLTYKVLFDENLEKDGDWGRHKGRKQELLVNPTMSDEQRAITIIHEVLHSARMIWGVHLTENDVDRLANCLANFLAELGVEFDWADVPTKKLEI